MTSSDVKWEPCPEYNFSEDFNTWDQRVYENSLCAILAAACEELFPEKRLVIAHSISMGLYAKIEPYRSLPRNYISQIKNRMKEIIRLGESFYQLYEKAERIRQLLVNKNRPDLIRFLSHLDNREVTIYRLRNTIFWSQSEIVQRTSEINKFDIVPFHRGFILRFPTKGNRHALPAFIRQEKLFRIFDEFEHWGSVLEVEDLGQINDLIENKRISDFIKIAEALHEKKISRIADLFVHNYKKGRFIFIAGPSSSGKTTFMKRLEIQLRVVGKRITSISLDDYFIDRDTLTKRHNGKPNYEILEALDLDLLNKTLQDYMDGKTVQIPQYDFVTGKRVWPTQKTITPEENTIVLIEGIHGLNPGLVPEIPEDAKFRIYLSALTHLNIDNYNRISTRECRLIRRIVRDRLFRGYSASQTLLKWDEVAEGENKYIFPFQEEADVMFNSFLVYELAVLKKYAVPFLTESLFDRKVESEVRRLLQFFSYLKEIDDHEVPPTSILREFIGGSSFSY